jgi:dTDP-4-dehydrorhamnose 3,5-epimerase
MNNFSAFIEGVIVTELKQIVDQRGAVLHMLRSDEVDFTKFGECYFSEVLPGAVKAWKLHTLQTQNLSVPIGMIKLVIYDDREYSNSRFSIFAIELGRPDSYVRVKIPPGLWYGFSCIGNSKALLVNCSDIPHDKMESRVLDSNDRFIPYNWKENLNHL